MNIRKIYNAQKSTHTIELGFAIFVVVAFYNLFAMLTIHLACDYDVKPETLSLDGFMICRKKV